MSDSPETLAEIVHRIDDLEQRVYILEHGREAHTAQTRATAASDAPLGPPGWPAQSGSIFPVLGIAMLGMAGAYLLRAVAESGAVPNAVAVSLATGYAVAWLIAAAKLHDADSFSRTTYACVSALTLAPMLWESTTRFHYMPAGVTAAVLAAFFVGSYVLVWRTRLASVVWITTLAIAIAAILLSFATHEFVAFTAVALGIALLNEIASASGRWSGTRGVSAAVADFLVLAALFIYCRPSAARGEYPEVDAGLLLGSGLLLFAIYGVSCFSRAVLQQQILTYSEITQLAVSALLAFEAVVHFATAGQTAIFAGGCIVLSLAGYAGLFVQFNPETERRNYFVCGGFSLALMLVGCALAFGISWLAAIFGSLAMIGVVLGATTTQPSLNLHGLVYLLAAGRVSHAVGYAVHSMAGTFPQQPATIVWMVLAIAVYCYAAGPERMGGNRIDRALHLISAGLATGAAITLSIAATASLARVFLPPAPWHIAVVRTLCASVITIAIAGLGLRLRRLELVWLSYTLLGLLAIKLIVEDLRHGHAEYIAASIFLYALTLIAVPRLARKMPRDASARTAQPSRVGLSAVQHH